MSNNIFNLDDYRVDTPPMETPLDMFMRLFPDSEAAEAVRKLRDAEHDE